MSFKKCNKMSKLQANDMAYGDNVVHANVTPYRRWCGKVMFPPTTLLHQATHKSSLKLLQISFVDFFLSFYTCTLEPKIVNVGNSMNVAHA